MSVVRKNNRARLIRRIEHCEERYAWHIASRDKWLALSEGEVNSKAFRQIMLKWAMEYDVEAEDYLARANALREKV